MDKVLESIQRLRQEAISLNKKIIELEEAYKQEQKSHIILREDYNHICDEYIKSLRFLGL